ncbi:MAG: UDPglucose--hexose-1-phosphate uridylyltransferase [Parcubacteria group bacterium Athens0714_12]|nr:MAG: UDPglucose--hexose-1-phosphate uridylyltransferase [Parcubacteria group bacterium Athens0714_12]
MKSEIRKDYFLNKYVIITPQRAKRPRDLKEESILEPKVPCPFCEEGVEKELLIKTYNGGKNFLAKVLRNKFPVVIEDNSEAYGKQEVIIETPKHGLEFADLSISQIKRIVEVYIDRTKVIGNDKKIEYILVFKNDGGKAGASIFHAHSQIFASQVLPPDVLSELQQMHNYQTEKGACPYCEIIKKEEKSPRKIFSNKEVVAFCPYASAFHYEAWIFPRRHLDNITSLNKKEITGFAEALKKILVKLNSLDISYNFFLHQVIKDTDQHFYLKIQPRDSIWGGVELGSGMVVNSVLPEKAAKFYRE